ncbi:2-furoate---CoA ligase [Roseovarius pacificus]|uniref:2-furoate---CoA ligase n=1 Tax=Roseovarius pacificus TaxID=337701 RepID=A0A1M7A7U0_9RHOB|nr:AMP-binding protein [Roseovarius pacificus]GGO53790.1 4-chlorobenzoate--CoA ligase [Roseovarius pacificus]SHL38735.1 2-furoate---CoA ligase [Roseovarius pacificus]
MLDLGRSLVASVSRAPDALALVDGDIRLTYGEWYGQISALTQGLADMGLRQGDRIVTALQNNRAAASVHWACQLAGIAIVPVNWRATPDELGFYVANSDARSIIFDASSEKSVREAEGVTGLPKIAYGIAVEGATSFDDIVMQSAPDATPQASAEDCSVMLYTSGTTARPKGVPRRHRAERAGAVAHVAQNMMPMGDTTLGVMPLYHTMGVRSLLAMTLLNGTFVCLPRFSCADALNLIAKERIGSLYLVPTLYHDLIDHPDFERTDLSSVKRLGFAGASMTEGLLKRINAAFRPDLFVNHYGSSEVYTFSIEQDAVAKPGSAGKAGLNQHLRVVAMGAGDPDAVLPRGEEGEIIATLSGDEAFEGYWKRPEANEKSLCRGWFFTGDCGHFDADGDLFVTGRVDDMIITGGENVSPVEVESCLSMHPGVAECAVVGLPDDRWGKIVTAFIKRRGDVTAEELDLHCRTSALANFKRPRRIVFVSDLPKSPVGKLLRRELVAGNFTPEHEQATAK